MNSRVWPAALGFSLQMWLSATISLGIAFLLQMDSPYWAPIAACIVSQPAPGMAVSKAIYRLGGTVLGAAMGILLIALFAQTPELFIVALAAWIGLCTLASNLLRNFRAYGAVLAGYTAAIVSLATYDQPSQVFLIGVARASCTIIGIMCALGVTFLLAPHRARPQVMARLRTAMGRVAARIAFPFDSSLTERLAVGRRTVELLIALDPEIDFAAAEDPGFRIHAEGVRSLVVHLFETISARRALEARIERMPSEVGNDLTELIVEMRSVFSALAAGMETGSEDDRDREARLEGLREKLVAASERIDGEAGEAGVTRRIALDRSVEMVDSFRAALQEMGKIGGPYVKRTHLSLNFHRDHRLAIINAARAFLALSVAGWFWIESEWPTGATMLTQVGVVCSLFSASPQPDRQGFSFFIGTLYAAGASFICLFFILNRLEGFMPLALVLGLFLIPGGVAMFFPKTTGVGFAYSVNFLGLLHPFNMMDYDISSFLNGVLATLAGVIMGTMAYQLFLPPDPHAERRYVVHRIRRGLEIISSRLPAPPAWVWQTRMYDRVMRLYEPKNPSGTPTDQWYEEGLAALNLGNEILRVRALANAEAGEAVRPVLAAFSCAAAHPTGPPRAVQETQRELERTPVPEESVKRRDFFRLKGAIQEISFYLETYGSLTRPFNRKWHEGT